MIFNEEDVIFKAVKSQGPGGQRVNKRSTKAQIWIRIVDLKISEEKREILRKKLSKFINKKGEFGVSCDEENSQIKNKKTAIFRANKILTEALIYKRRKKTKKPKIADENRIKNKKFLKEKKLIRRESRIKSRDFG